MERHSLEQHLNELKDLPTNELNIRRLAEVTTALKNFHMLENETITTNATKEIKEAEDSLKRYMQAKTSYCMDKTPQNAEGVEYALKTLLTDIEQTITEILSLCEFEKEKEIIETSLMKYLNQIT